MSVPAILLVNVRCCCVSVVSSKQNDQFGRIVSNM